MLSTVTAIVTFPFNVHTKNHEDFSSTSINENETIEPEDIAISGPEKINTVYNSGTIAYSCKINSNPDGSKQWGLYGRPISGVSINANTGVVSYSNLQSGTYNIYVIYIWLDNINLGNMVYSKAFHTTLVINSLAAEPTSFTLIGPSSISIPINQSDRKLQYRVDNFQPENLTNRTVTWSLENADTNYFSIDQSGLLTIKAFTSVAWTGAKTISIVATSNQNKTLIKKKDLMVVINIGTTYQNVIPKLSGDTTIRTYTNNYNPGWQFASWYENPSTPNTMEVRTNAFTYWTVSDETNFFIGYYDGLFRIKTTVPGTYTVKIILKTQWDVQSEYTLSVTIYSFEDPKEVYINGPESYLGANDLANSVRFTTTFLPYLKTSSGTTWSLSEDSNTANGQITLSNNGTLSWPDTLLLGEYQLTIIATSTTHPDILQKQNFLLTLTYPPKLTDITLTKASGDAILNNNTIDQVYGTTSTFQADCNITNPDNINPNYSKQWTLDNNIQGVSIDSQTGLITISNLTPQISTRIYVYCEVGKTKISKYFQLNVNYAIPILEDITLQGTGVVDNQTINLLPNQATTINAFCNIANSNNIDPGLSKSWSIQNQPAGVTINNTTGEISIPNNLAFGDYSFTLTYQCGSDSKQSTINLIIGYETPQLDSIELTGDGVSDNNINLTYNQSANISASCNITNEANIDPSLAKSWSLNNAPSGISINSNGQLTIPTTQVVNDVAFEIIYQVGGVRESLSVSLTISYANPVLGDITLTKVSGEANIEGNIINQTLGTTSTFNASSNITNPNNIDPNLPKIWSINNAPSGVSIDGTTGLVTIASPNYGSNQAINVTYTVGSVSKNATYVLNVVYATPIFGEITLAGDGVLDDHNINLTYNQSTSISASCNITNEANIDPSLTKSWSLNNAPSGSSINNNGQLTIPTTQILNNVSFNIIYQVGTVRQTLSVNLTISYANPVLGDITLTKASGDATITGNIINQVYGNASTFNASCNITNNGNIDPSLAKTWSLNNAPSGVSINANTGLITFSNSTAKVSNHAFSVTYTVGTITKTQNYTLNVGYATPIFSDITLQGTGIVDNNNINLSLNQAATINAHCSITNPNNIDPNLSKSWTIENQPAGVTINSNTGAISIPNNLAIGNYTFTLTYQCGTYNKQSTITLSIGYETPILSNITLSSANNVTIQGSNVSIDYHTSGSFQATCDVTNQPNINPSLTKTWSLANAPNGVSINNNGLVTIAIDMNKVTNQAITINCNIGGVSKTLTFYLSTKQDLDDNKQNDNTFVIVWGSLAVTLLIVIMIFYVLVFEK